MASTPPTTITREHFLSLMAAGGEGSAELVKQLLSEGPWASKQSFTQADVVYVMDAVAAYGRKAFASNPAALADPEGQAHAIGLIDSLQAHVLPLLHREVQKEG